MDTSTDIRERLAKKLWDIEHPQDKAVLRVEFEEYPKSIDFIQEHYKKVDSILQVFKEYIESKKKTLDYFQPEINAKKVIGYTIDVSIFYNQAIKEILEGLEKENL